MSLNLFPFNIFISNILSSSDVNDDDTSHNNNGSEDPQSSFLLQAGASIGLALTAALWSVATWRLLSHFIGFTVCKTQDLYEQRPLAEGMTMRRMFHLLLWIAMLVELVGYLFYLDIFPMNFILEMKFGYALVSTFGKAMFEFNAYAVVTLYWFKSMARARAGLSERKMVFRIYPALLLLGSISLASHSYVEIVDLLGPNNPYNRLVDFKIESPIHRHQLLFGAFAWGIHGILVIVCGAMMYQRLSKLPLYIDLRAKQKAPIMTRIMIPLVLCSLAYLFRAALLITSYVRIVGYTGPEADAHFEQGPFWWFFAEWIPTLIPATILLYALRKRDRVGIGVGGPGEALLPQPTPPEEVFQSFKHSIYNEFNDTDALSYLVSSDVHTLYYEEEEKNEDELEDISPRNKE